MPLEEVLKVPYLPRNGYDNPVYLKVNNYQLEVAYSEGGIFRVKHFIDEKGMSKGYETYKLKTFPKDIFIGFIQNELKERYQMDEGKYIPFREATKEVQFGILKVLMSHEDFYREYRKLEEGFYDKSGEVKVIENKATLSKKEFDSVLYCYKILKEASELVKDEQIKFFIMQADLFDKRLLLSSLIY